MACGRECRSRRSDISADSQRDPTPPPPDYGASAVFRGTVIEKKLLPARTEMQWRDRYAITFRIDECWKGSHRRNVVVYGMRDGTDCKGGSSYEVGKRYLVFAEEHPSQDVIAGELFWYGWTDVVPKGTSMLEPQGCTPSGEVSKEFVIKALKRLGKGFHPSEGN